MFFKQTKLPVWLLLILAPLLWSGNVFIGSALKNTIPPFTLAFYRWLWVVILLSPFVLKSLLTQLAIIKANFVKILLLSFFSVSCYSSLLYMALHHTDVINAGMINAIVPMMILFLSSVIGLEGLDLKKILAGVISLFGVSIIILKGHLFSVENVHFNRGDLLVLGACLCWAVYSVLLHLFKIKLSPFVFLYTTACIGSVLLFPFSLHEMIQANNYFLTDHSLGALLYIALFTSILGYTCWNQGVKRIGSSKSAVYYNLLAPFSAMWGILFLHESLRWYHLMGFACIFFSILFVRAKAQQKD